MFDMCIFNLIFEMGNFVEIDKFIAKCVLIDWDLYKS